MVGMEGCSGAGGGVGAVFLLKGFEEEGSAMLTSTPHGQFRVTVRCCLCAIQA